jgi:hypothetical protein
VFGHEFSQNLIFGLDLLFQIFDPLLLALMVHSALTLEGSSSVLEELFLPTGLKLPSPVLPVVLAFADSSR